MTSRKRKLTNNTDCKDNVSYSGSSKFVEVADWLKEQGAQGLDDLQFRQSHDHGLGCFAGRDFIAGDVLFTIPTSCIFGLGVTKDKSTITETLRMFVKDSAQPIVLTSELLIWLHMIHAKYDASSPFHRYFSSLSEVSPSMLSWPEELRTSCVEGTNLASVLKYRDTIERYSTLLTDVRTWLATSHTIAATETASEQACFSFPETHFNLDTLLWACGHYLSRRYPGTFAADRSIRTGSDALDGRETGLQNLGTSTSISCCIVCRL